MHISREVPTCTTEYGRPDCQLIALLSRTFQRGTWVRVFTFTNALIVGEVPVLVLERGRVVPERLVVVLGLSRRLGPDVGCFQLPVPVEAPYQLDWKAL